MGLQFSISVMGEAALSSAARLTLLAAACWGVPDRKQVAGTARQRTSRPATTSQILCYAIAHEIGYLLGLGVHTEMGIPRAAWLSNDLLNLAYGDLAFTAQQAAIIRNQTQIRQQSAEAE